MNASHQPHVSLFARNGWLRGAVASLLLLGAVSRCPGQNAVLGPPDPAFNAPAIETVASSFGVAVQPDGKLLLGGAFKPLSPDSTQPIGMVRLNTNGSLDSTFAFSAYLEGVVRTILPLPDGTFLAGGGFSAQTSSGQRRGLVKLTSTGSVVTAFARFPEFGGEIWSLALDPAGKILVAGGFSLNLGNRQNLVRLLPTGGLDTSFNTGANEQQFPVINGIVQKVIVLTDGRILAVGGFNLVSGRPRAGIAVLMPNGGVDPSFDYAGDHDCCVTDALVMDDGKIVVSGTFTVFNGLRMPGIARLLPNGELDRTFRGLPGRSVQIRGMALSGTNELLVSGVIGLPLSTNWWTTAQLSGDGEVQTALQTGPYPASGQFLVHGGAGEIYQAEISPQPSGTSNYRVVRLPVSPRAPAIPRITVAPGPVTIGEGNPLVLAVEHEAEPRPTYQWLRGGTALPGETNQTLQISSVRVAAAGEYQLRIENSQGSVTSSVIRLDVQPAATGPGRLDLEFDPGAGVQNALGSIVELADGKLLISGGFTQVQGLTRPRLARLLVDGRVDPAFVPQTAEFSSMIAIAPAPDGAVVALGFLHPTAAGQRWKVVRLLGDGSPDPAFTAFTSTSGTWVQAMAVADGFIYIGGSYDGNSSGLFRLLPSGRRDTSYKLVIDNVPTQILPAADGKLLLMGYFTTIEGRDRKYLARLHSNGTLDASFNAGVIYTDTVPEHMALQPDGKVIVSDNYYGGGGWRWRSWGGGAGTPEPRLLRFNQDGTLDSSFLPELNPTNQISAVAVQPSGEILVATFPFNYYDIAPAPLVRLFPDGSIDYGFDQTSDALNTTLLVPTTGGGLIWGGYFSRVSGVLRNGMARIDARPSPLEGPTVVRQPSSQQVASGATLRLSAAIRSAPPAAYQWQRNGINLPGETNRTLVRRNVGPADSAEYRLVISNPLGSTASAAAQVVVQPPRSNPGSVDVEFFTGDGPNGAVNQLIELPDGKVLIAGDFTAVDGQPRPRIARLNADGSLDASFAPAEGPNNEITSMALLNDGQIAIGGPFDNFGSSGRSFIAVLRPDGSLNKTNAISADGRVLDLAVTPDGRIRGCGESFLRGWNADGTPDSKFPTINFEGVAIALALQSDGKVVFAGNFTTDGSTRANIARAVPGAALDPTFKPGAGSSDRIDDVAIQPDGKMVIAGAFTHFDGTPRGRLARLNPDGSLDPAFPTVDGADDGRIVAIGHFGLRDVTGVHTVALEPNGRILIGGDFTTFERIPVGQFVRLYPDGALDESFELGAGFPIQPPRLGAWFNEYMPFSSRWISRIQPGANQAIFVMGNFPGIDGVDRPKLLKLHGGEIEPAAPIVRSEFQTLTARTGTNVVLSVKTIANPQPSFQWLLNGRPIPGAIKPSLQLQNVGRAAQGEYTLLISNALGAVEFKAGQLDISPPRLSPGAIDTGFYPELEENSTLTAVWPELDGGLILAGSRQSSTFGGIPTINRIGPNGQLDLVWNTGTMDIRGGGLNRAVSLLDGSILVSGSLDVMMTNGTTRNISWIRVKPDGALDSAFKAPTGIYSANAMLRLRDGKIIAAGDSSRGYRLYRLLPDGTVDASFPSTLTCAGQVTQFVEDDSGRILVAGDFTAIGGSNRDRIVRLSPSGQLDNTFNSKLRINGGVTALALLADGSIVAGGWFGLVDNTSKPRLARLSADGVLDPSFPLPNPVFNYDIQAIAASPDGTVFLAGYFPTVPDTGAVEFNVIAIDASGEVHPTFDTGAGFRLFQGLDRLGGPVIGLSVTPFGKLLVTGPFDAVDELPRPQIARLFLDAGPRLLLRQASGHWQFLWDSGMIEQSSSVNGPWNPAPAATSPWSVDLLEGPKFFRLRYEP